MTLPFDLDKVARWLEGTDRSYRAAKNNDPKRRFYIIKQLEILVDVAGELGLAAHLGPTNRLIKELLEIHLGHKTPSLLRPIGNRPRGTIPDIRWRAHLAAAAEFFYRANRAEGRPDAAKKVIREGKIHDLKSEKIDNWRQKLSAADPERDIEADRYRRLTNPGSWLVPGYAEAGPMNDNQYAIWLINQAKTMGYRSQK